MLILTLANIIKGNVGSTLRPYVKIRIKTIIFQCFKPVISLKNFYVSLTASAIIGAIIPPICPMVLHRPMAALLAVVGNKSAVKEKTVA